MTRSTEAVHVTVLYRTIHNLSPAAGTSKPKVTKLVHSEYRDEVRVVIIRLEPRLYNIRDNLLKDGGRLSFRPIIM